MSLSLGCTFVGLAMGAFTVLTFVPSSPIEPTLFTGVVYGMVFCGFVFMLTIACAEEYDLRKKAKMIFTQQEAEKEEEG